MTNIYHRTKTKFSNLLEVNNKCKELKIKLLFYERLITKQKFIKKQM